MTQFGMSEDDFQKYLKAEQWGQPIHKNQVLVDKDELSELRRGKQAFESIRETFEKQCGAMDALAMNRIYFAVRDEIILVEREKE